MANNTLFGFHMDISFSPDADVRRTTLAHALEVNSEVSRNTLSWADIEKTKGAFDWSKVDALVNELSAVKMKPLFTIYSSPGWANGTSQSDPDGWLKVPTDPAKFATWVKDYTNFIQKAAARYGDKVLWEIGNESNEHFFWNPAPQVDQFVTWYKSLYGAIKTAAPDAQVAMGGLTGLNASGTQDITGLKFLKAVYDKGVRPDIVSIHPYPGQNQAPDKNIQWENNFSDIKLIRDLMVSYGQSDKAMWVTEWGWPTKSVSEADQAAFLKASMEMLVKDYSYVTVATYFNQQDVSNFTHGVYASDWRMKPSADSFYDFVSDFRGGWKTGGATTATMSGGTSADTMTGTSANNLIDGRAGADTMRGGAGDDSYRVDNIADKVVEAAGGGTDTVHVTVTDYVLPSQVENGQIAVGEALRLVGNSGNNILTGNSGGDNLVGDAGNDKLVGLAGDDLLYGGAGNDLLKGGNGNDTLYADIGNDMVDGGAGADTLYGSSGDDRLLGGSGDDLLYGDLGSDILVGGAGADRFMFTRVTDSHDTIVDYGAAQRDKIDMTEMFDRIGYTGANPIADGYIRFVQTGTSTVRIDLDPNGGGDGFGALVTVLGQSIDQIKAGLVF